jgi:predicted AlkP superfamily pyrophosphatase or phosphodiesterase
LRRFSSPALTLGLAVALAAGVGCTEFPTATDATRPKLVLLLAIDQLRPERLDPAQPGGLGRLQREGRTFVDAALTPAFTETCAGHATMLTGRTPAAVGVPGNSYTDPETLEGRYCVEDRAPDAALLGVPGEPADGRSPRVMRASTLGDWLKEQQPGSRVFAVSGKDRSAIAMVGRDADAAYWLARGASPQFTTSAYYMASLPEWVSAWSGERVLALWPEHWEYLPESAAVSAATNRIDDYEHESRLHGRAAPHPVLADPPGVERLPERMRHPSERAYVTPFADDVSLAFARELVERENLGGGPATDLLAVGLSATDLVGHFYGPESWESRDALSRLDAAIGDFLAFLEARVGAGRLLVVVTADHGVLTLPEWLVETGRSKCTLPGGRLNGKKLITGVNARLDERFGAAVEGEKAWLVAAYGRLTLNRKRATRVGASPADVIESARAHLEGAPGVAHAWTRGEVLAGTGAEPFATLYRNSWDEKITGDIALQFEEDCLMGDGRIATSHGSPYLYDRKVPLIFFGPGIAPGRVEGDAATVDIAPTIAPLVGITTPDDLDGRALPLR